MFANSNIWPGLTNFSWNGLPYRSVVTMMSVCTEIERCYREWGRSQMSIMWSGCMILHFLKSDDCANSENELD